MHLNKLVQNLGTESAFTVLARATSLAAQGKDIINLGIGQPDFSTPEHIVEAAVKALRDGHHGYTPAKGIAPLREAVAHDFKLRNGAGLNPENMLIVPGGKVTMAFAMLLLGGVGHEIMYPDPGFPIYGSMAGFSGARPVPYPLSADKGYGIDADDILSKVTDATRLIILNSPGNPTGGINTPGELRKLAAGLEPWPHVYVLSDEIYSRLYFDGVQHVSPLTLPGMADRTIILDGWSKTYAMTGWRLGWSYWPDALIDVAERLAINIHSCVNASAQYAALAALQGPQDAVDCMRSAFQERRDLVVRRFADMHQVSAPIPKGAFYAFPEIRVPGKTAEQIQDALLTNEGIALIAGTSFGAQGTQNLRLSFANSLENIECALEKLALWLNQQT